MAYDDVIPLIGGFGTYQKKIYFLLCLPAMTCAFHKLSGVFLQAVPKHRCAMPSEPANSSFELSYETYQEYYPWNEHTESWSTCQIYNISRIEKTAVSCDRYIYDRSVYQTTATTEWNMVCGRAYMRANSDALLLFGVLLGSYGFGDLSDRFGRKPTFVLALLVQVVFGILGAVAPNYVIFVIARILGGATTSGVFLVAYVISMEMVSPKKRMIAGTVCQMFFSLGYMFIALFAIYFPNWRDLQTALTLPGLLFFGYWWLIPESTRWLLSKNRKEDAKRNIKYMAKQNKMQVEDSTLDELLTVDESTKEAVASGKTPTIIDLFRHPNLRKKTLVIFFDWIITSGTYYGLSFSASNFSGNSVVNFVISGAVEIPAYCLILLTLNKWGRKPVLCGSLIIAGAVLLLTMIVPSNMPWLVTILALSGKLAITASYGTIYIFSVEQFPTVIRNVALGSSSMCARLGGISAPYINLTGEIWKPLPLIIFGLCAFLGGLVSLLLPETLNQKLPESIADGEKFGNQTNAEEAEDMPEAKPLNVQPEKKVGDA